MFWQDVTRSEAGTFHMNYFLEFLIIFWVHLVFTSLLTMIFQEIGLLLFVDNFLVSLFIEFQALLHKCVKLM